jgi:tetratricopeptide (TPR) repeat protein
MLPTQKITWGIVFTLLLITSPVGIPMLIIGLIQRNDPQWRMRTLVHKAAKAKTPDDAKALLDTAYSLEPNSPEVLGPLAEWFTVQGQSSDACDMYARYCAVVPSDWLARGHLGNAALQSGRYDEAIAAFQELLQYAPLADESRASITAHVADAFLHKGEVIQALELVKAQPLQRRNLGPGLQQCLYLRGVTSYLSGQRSRGISDMDRLYALAPTFSGLVEAKASMNNGTFVYDLGHNRRLEAPRPNASKQDKQSQASGNADQSVAAEPHTDAVAKLRELADLRDQGVITPQDFEVKKKDLLTRI